MKLFRLKILIVSMLLALVIGTPCAAYLTSTQQIADSVSEIVRTINYSNFIELISPQYGFSLGGILLTDEDRPFIDDSSSGSSYVRDKVRYYCGPMVFSKDELSRSLRIADFDTPSSNFLHRYKALNIKILEFFKLVKSPFLISKPKLQKIPGNNKELRKLIKNQLEVLNNKKTTDRSPSFSDPIEFYELSFGKALIPESTSLYFYKARDGKIWLFSI